MNRLVSSTEGWDVVELDKITKINYLSKNHCYSLSLHFFHISCKSTTIFPSFLWWNVKRIIFTWNISCTISSHIAMQTIPKLSLVNIIHSIGMINTKIHEIQLRPFHRFNGFISGQHRKNFNHFWRSSKIIAWLVSMFFWGCTLLVFVDICRSILVVDYPVQKLIEREENWTKLLSLWT